MYQPPQFREDSLGVQHALIRQHPLGLLITAGAGGLSANFIPFVLDPDGSSLGTLRGHLARANPQVADLAGTSECLAVFKGPDDYITPSWYATKRETGRVVPTWNFITVHAWGSPRLVADASWLRAQIEALTHLQEDRRPAPWQVADAPEDFVTAQIKGIIGLEIPIARVEGKWKVSQNRPASDRAGVIDGLRRAGGDAMAAAVAEAAAEPGVAGSGSP